MRSLLDERLRALGLTDGIDSPSVRKNQIESGLHTDAWRYRMLTDIDSGKHLKLNSMKGMIYFE